MTPPGVGRSVTVFISGSPPRESHLTPGERNLVEERSRVAPWAPPRAQLRLAELEAEVSGLGLDAVTRLVDAVLAEHRGRLDEDGVVLYAGTNTMSERARAAHEISLGCRPSMGWPGDERPDRPGGGGRAGGARPAPGRGADGRRVRRGAAAERDAGQPRLLQRVHRPGRHDRGTAPEPPGATPATTPRAPPGSGACESSTCPTTPDGSTSTTRPCRRSCASTGPRWWWSARA